MVRRFSAICALCFVLLAGLGARCLGQEIAADYLEPRVDRTQFAVFCQALGLEPDQRAIIELLFTDYGAGLDQIAKDLDAQGLKAGQQTVKDALAGKSRVAPDELKRLRLAVLNVYQQAGPQADQAFDSLLAGVQSLLNPEQEPNFPPAARDLRRKVLLHPRQSTSDYQEYAGDGVDVLLLTADAMAEGGELQPLGLEPLQDVLHQYELALDALLIDSAAADRDGRIARKGAKIEKNPASIHQHEQAALTRWKRLYELNKSAVQQIGDIAAQSLGEEAQRRWLERFDQASFTWLYPRKKPDRQIEWMRDQDLPAATLEKADAIHENYISQRKVLSRQAIDMMLRGRLEFETILYSMMDPTGIDDRVRRGLYEELLKNSGELANLESTTAGSLEALLTDQQRQKMRDAMARPDRARRP